MQQMMYMLINLRYRVFGSHLEVPKLVQVVIQMDESLSLTLLRLVSVQCALPGREVMSIGVQLAR